MKHLYSFLLLTLISLNCVFAQLTPPADLQVYYSGVNFNDTGLDLFDELAVPTVSKHTNELSYTPGIWECSKNTDEDPNNNDNVLLIYGYNDTDGNNVTDRTRDKDLNGGNNGTDWNREHTFPNASAVPDLDDAGRNGPPYADGHNLRPSDVQMNSNRGSRKFAAGSGNAGTVGSNWYPGDEWKGDAARIIMYMYMRYGNQCLPRYASAGVTNSIDPNMINILLEWNAEDPVSATEDNRNTYHGGNDTYAQGNRNPFIDNPYLATLIWGGIPAENRWGVQPPADTEAPTNPTALNASNPSYDSVDLSWMASTDNVGVTGYDVYVDGVFYVSTTSSTSYTVTGLMAETTYSFSILAKDAAGNTSNLSNSANETTLEAPIFCTNETFQNIPASNSSYLTRTWAGDDGGTWTATEARTDRTITGRAITLDGRGSTNGTLTSPMLSGGIGTLSFSTKKEFTAGPNSGTLNVYVNGVFISAIAYFDFVTTTTIPDINVEGNANVVITEDNNDNRVSIDDLSWTCYSTLGDDDIRLDTISVYPNPVNGNSIAIKSKVDLDYTIFDILGKKVIQGQVSLSKNNISVSSLNKGVYIVQLKSKTGSVTKKLIKQ